MEARGILHAASGAEKTFPLGILDNVRPSGPDTQGRFSRELDREVNKLDKSRDLDKPRETQPREGERTKESNLGNKRNGPEAAWDREGRKAVVKKDRNIGPAARKEEATRKEPETGDTADKAVDSKPAINALKDWLIWFLEAIASARRVEFPGPGGSTRLDEGQLGPRFAELAPTAITLIRGKLGAMLTPQAAEGEPPPQASEGGISASNIQPGANPETSNTAADNVPRLDVTLIEMLFAKGWGAGKFSRATDTALEGSQTVPEISAKSFTAGEMAQPDASRSANRIDAGLRGLPGVSASGLPINDGEIEFLSEPNFAARLAELISKAGEALRLGGFASVKETLLGTGKTGINPDGPGKPAGLVDSPLPAGTGPLMQGLGQWGFGATLLNPGLGETEGASEAVAGIKPGDTIFAAEIERVALGVDRDAITGIRLRLHPPELGHLVINFRRDENGLRVEFHTSNPAVMKMLEEAGPKMMERLQDAGVDIGSLDVFLNNESPDDRRTFSPLDNPGNPPGGLRGLVETSADGGNISGRKMYFSGDESLVDLLV